LGNTLWAQGTCWKLEGNIIRTSWEHIENNKSPTPSPKDFFFFFFCPLGVCYLTSLVVGIFSCLSMFFFCHCWPRLMLGAWTMRISNPQMDSARCSFPIANSTFLFFYLAILSNCQVHYDFWTVQMCFKLPKFF